MLTVKQGNPRNAVCRIAVATMTVLAAAAPLCAQAAGAAPQERRTRIAVMEFRVSAMTQRDEVAPLSLGLPQMLGDALAANPRLEMVDRVEIQKVLAEQNLGTAGRVDPATAAQVGKIVGAEYVLLGDIVVDLKNEMRVSVRAVNAETSVYKYTEQVSGNTEKVYNLVDQLAGKLNAGLKLPGIRDAKAGKSVGVDGPNQYQAAKIRAQAARLEDSGEYKAAIALYKKSLDLNGEQGMLRTRVAMLEKKSAP